jgi:hypothetical protein
MSDLRPTEQDAVYNFDFMPVAEWDWTVLPSWGRLHAPLRRTATVCGRVGDLAIPGLFSRDAVGGLPRCVRCCAVTGMPRGYGAPKNGSRKCRAVARRRIEERSIQ